MKRFLFCVLWLVSLVILMAIQEFVVIKYDLNFWIDWASWLIVALLHALYFTKLSDLIK